MDWLLEQILGSHYVIVVFVMCLMQPARLQFVNIIYVKIIPADFCEIELCPGSGSFGNSFTSIVSFCNAHVFKLLWPKSWILSN